MTLERTQQVIEDDPEDHDRGLSFDINTLMSRRKALGLFAVTGIGLLAGCGTSNDDGAAASTTSGATTSADTTATTSTDVSEIPEETGGPYPADGSNGPNVLSESGVVRRDITTSFGGYSGTAEGVPLTINLTILDVAEGGTPLAGAAVYIWHCDRAAAYSLYDAAAADQNYLRGVQESDADGKLTFQTIFPGCYAGRWPHIHFEVFPSLAEATTSGRKLVTSQIALPEEACVEVYAEAGYEQSVSNLAGVSLVTDMVFSDGYSTQLGKVSGKVGLGLAVALNVGV